MDFEILQSCVLKWDFPISGNDLQPKKTRSQEASALSEVDLNDIVLTTSMSR